MNRDKIARIITSAIGDLLSDIYKEIYDEDVLFSLIILEDQHKNFNIFHLTNIEAEQVIDIHRRTADMVETDELVSNLMIDGLDGDA